MRRPTLLAVVAEAGDEALAPGGTLASSAWRGMQPFLVTLRDGDEPPLRAASARAARLLGVENHFHWEGEPDPVRLARTLRALQPAIVVTNGAARAVSEAAWALAADEQLRMPGLPLFPAAPARLWAAVQGAAASARVDVSAARPLLRALRFYYHGTARGAALAALPGLDGGPLFESFALLRGQPIAPLLPATDLPSLFPISFLAEENQ